MIYIKTGITYKEKTYKETSHVIKSTENNIHDIQGPNSI